MCLHSVSSRAAPQPLFIVLSAVCSTCGRASQPRGLRCCRKWKLTLIYKQYWTLQQYQNVLLSISIDVGLKQLDSICLCVGTQTVQFTQFFGHWTVESSSRVSVEFYCKVTRCLGGEDPLSEDPLSAWRSAAARGDNHVVDICHIYIRHCFIL